jgi:lipopolysaccharide export system permease protein
VRILDRQRYWAFLKAYVICFTALVGLYVVIDAFSNFDEFTKRAQGAVAIFGVMGRYYLVHMTEFYDRLCGVIGMMAAIFTVTWMQKNNELLAMMAAGISTQRVIRPVIISAVIVSSLAVANQEWLMPRVAEELMKPHADDGSLKVRVPSTYDSNQVMIHGDEADRDNQTVARFFTTVPAEIYGTIYELEARQGRYIPPDHPTAPLKGGWIVRGAKINQPLPADENDDPGAILVKLESDKGFPPPTGDLKDLGGDTYFLRTSLTFKALTRRRQWYWYAPTPDLVRAISDPVNSRDSLEMSVFLHGRILRSFLALALLFVTLPQVLGGYDRNMFVNLGMSLGTAACFYGLNFMAQYLGANKVCSPELAAWAPLIGFGSFAVFRWDSIRT